MIKDSTLLGEYKNEFDPQQLEMESYLQGYIQNNTTADENLAALMSRCILKVVLGEFRPEMLKERQYVSTTN